MSKSDKSDNRSERAPEADEPRKGSAARQVADNVLGDMLGVGAKKEPAAELPEEDLELVVEEDRTRLLLTGLGFLLADVASLFLALGFWGAANLTGNVVFLILVLAMLTVTWFTSRATGRRLARFFSKTDVVAFGRNNVFLYEKSDPRKARVVSYRDIKNYQIIRQGSALRLLLAGSWVTHPSGLYLVDINRRHMAGTLDDLNEKIIKVMREHRVPARR